MRLQGFSSLKGIVLGATGWFSTTLFALASVSLIGPGVVKVEWDTRSLRAADLNGDGLTDLAVINNSRSRIDIFLQQPEGQTVDPIQRSVRRDRWEPVLEDARFRRESVGVRGQVFSLLVTDLNGDGLPDLVYTGADVALTVRYQLPEGGFSEPVTYTRFDAMPWPSTLAVARLGPEQVPALIVLARGKLLVFKQGVNGLEFPPQEFLMTGNSHALLVRDIDGDGLEDILYFGDSREERLRLRRQLENGAFGPEYGFRSRWLRGALAGLPEISGQKPLFAAIEEANRHIRVVSLEPGIEPDAAGEPFLQPQVHPVLSGEGRASYALGNFRGDDQLTLIVADPGKPALQLYPWKGELGFSSAREFPSLSGITGLFRLQQSGVSDRLVVFSRSENYLGWSVIDEDGRLTFPRPWRIEGEPLAAGVSRLTQSSPADAVVVVTRRGRAHFWSVLDAATGNEVWSEEIPEVRRSPEHMFFADLNGDGKREVILLTPREPARVFRQDDEGGLSEIAANSSVRRSLLNDLNPARLAIVPALDGAAGERLVVAGRGFARMVGMDETGDLIILDQFNALRGEDEVFAPLVFDFNEDGVADLFLHQPSENAIQWIRRNEDGVFRHEETLRAGEITLVESGRVLPDGSLFYPGTDRFWRVPVGPPGFSLKYHGEYETDLRQVAHSLLAAGRLSGDGDSIEIVAIDGNRHVLELLSLDADFAWTSLLHFPVFERNIHFQGRGGSAHEPREILLTDLSGNGREDVVLLVHDRILYYLSEE